MRYSAKILLQYRVGDAHDSQFRVCEERIIVIESTNATKAHAVVVRIAKSSESKFINDDGEWVYVEFIGVLELMELGVECEAHDVWYEIKTMLRPMERIDVLVPKREDLSVFRNMGVTGRRGLRKPKP